VQWLFGQLLAGFLPVSEVQLDVTVVCVLMPVCQVKINAIVSVTPFLLTAHVHLDPASI